MGRWAMLGMVAVLLAACGSDGRVCDPGERLGRCTAGGTPGSLTCNASGTGPTCDTTRECGPEIACAGSLVCATYGDPSATYGQRSLCTVRCTTSTGCPSGCCGEVMGGVRACIGSTPWVTCLR